MKFRFRFFIVLSLLLVLLPVNAQQDTNTASKPVIVDTDMAVDDWMAILYLLQRTDVDLLALTIAGTGEAHCNPGIQNAMNLAAMAGHPNIPVACGRETPLKGSNTFPQEWRDNVDSMAGLRLQPNPNALLQQTAVDLLDQTIKNANQKVTLVTLGPLTNIAELVTADPAIIEKLSMIYVMGGAVDSPGNVRPYVENDFAEWNIYVDPLAAAQVLESGAPMTFIALDATNHAPFTMAFYNRLRDDKTTPEVDFIYRALSQQLGFIQSGGYYFWDPLTAVAATDESVITLQGRPVSIITDEGAQFGRTMLDGKGNRVRVAADTDVSRFEQIFLNVLNGRDPSQPLTASTVMQPEATVPAMTPVESAADIIGIWRWQTASFHLRFDTDGTYRANETLQGLNSDSPEDVGTYQVDNGMITLTSGAATQFCASGDVGAYQLSLTPTGRLAFVLQKDACSVRNPPSSTPQLFDPISADGASLAFPTGTFVSELYLWTLNGDGTDVFGTADGQVITSGTYAVKGNTIQWVTDTYCGTAAAYSWVYQNDTLIVKPIGEDACKDRQTALSTPYILQGAAATPIPAAVITPTPGEQVAQSADLQVTEGSQTRNVTLNYLLYLPQDYDANANQHWPFVLFLHGYGERGSNLDQLKVHGIPKLVEEGQDFPFIAVSPQLSLTQYTWADQENELAALIASLQLEYRIDAKRIYVIGISLGGNGTWHFALAYPDIPAAIAPIAGWYGDYGSALDAPANICDLKKLPIWVFHGTADTTVLPQESQVLVDALKTCGADVKFTLYPGADHDKTFQLVDSSSELFDWLLAQSK